MNRKLRDDRDEAELRRVRKGEGSKVIIDAKSRSN